MLYLQITYVQAIPNNKSLIPFIKSCRTGTYYLSIVKTLVLLRCLCKVLFNIFSMYLLTLLSLKYILQNQINKNVCEKYCMLPYLAHNLLDSRFHKERNANGSCHSCENREIPRESLNFPSKMQDSYILRIHFLFYMHTIFFHFSFSGNALVTVSSSSCRQSFSGNFSFLRLFSLENVFRKNRATILAKILNFPSLLV